MKTIENEAISINKMRKIYEKKNKNKYHAYVFIKHYAKFRIKCCTRFHVSNLLMC